MFICFLIFFCLSVFVSVWVACALLIVVGPRLLSTCKLVKLTPSLTGWNGCPWLQQMSCFGVCPQWVGVTLAELSCLPCPPFRCIIWGAGWVVFWWGLNLATRSIGSKTFWEELLCRPRSVATCTGLGVLGGTTNLIAACGGLQVAYKRLCRELRPTAGVLALGLFCGHHGISWGLCWVCGCSLKATFLAKTGRHIHQAWGHMLGTIKW